MVEDLLLASTQVIKQTTHLDSSRISQNLSFLLVKIGLGTLILSRCCICLSKSATIGATHLGLSQLQYNGFPDLAGQLKNLSLEHQYLSGKPFISIDLARLNKAVNEFLMFNY